MPLTTCASFQPRLTASCTPRLMPCPPARRVDVRGVAGDQHPAGPVGGRLPGGVGEREIQVGSWTPKSVP